MIAILLIVGVGMRMVMAVNMAVGWLMGVVMTVG